MRLGKYASCLLNIGCVSHKAKEQRLVWRSKSLIMSYEISFRYNNYDRKIAGEYVRLFGIQKYYLKNVHLAINNFCRNLESVLLKCQSASRHSTVYIFLKIGIKPHPPKKSIFICQLGMSVDLWRVKVTKTWQYQQ